MSSPGARIGAVAAVAGLIWIATDPVAPAAGADGVSSSVLRRLESTAARIASRGHPEAARLVVGALADLGCEADDLERARERVEEGIARAGGRRRGAEREAKILRNVAADLAGELPGAPEEAREGVARAILRLDGTVAAAHEALGHVRHDGRWVTPRLDPVLDRRAEIRQAVQRARRLEFELRQGASDLPPVRVVAGGPGRSVHWKTTSLHSPTIGTERLRRILTEALRAWTFSHWLATGKLEPPPAQRLELVLLRSEAEYLPAAREALANGGLKERYAEAALEHWGGYNDDRGFHVSWDSLESGHQALVLRELWWWEHGILTQGTDEEPIQPCLHKGYLNWLCQTMLGADTPGWGFEELVGDGRPGASTTTPATEARRRRLIRYAKTGIAGIRSYLAWLARRGEDPAFANSIVARSALLAGEHLLKAMLVVEYLLDTGEFPELLKETARKSATGGTFSEALGESLADFEGRWREWLLVDDTASAAAELLDSPPDADGPPPPALERLNELRSEALADPEEVVLEAGLSEACRKHALYLVANPEQQGAWPDCHEEYSDREGFTVEGVRAGARSVIAPGAADGPSAVDAWMGTFYHRLPLLHPGLLAVGWAHEGGVAVLDSGSLVMRGRTAPAVVAWPAPGARDVPLAFIPELPNPVPGEDQSRWGYPVTLQFSGARPERVDVSMRLYEGAPDRGVEVPCHFSAPDRPTNPLLAPRDAYCLIPKSHLKPGTSYSVVVDRLQEDAPAAVRTGWSFTTGR